MQIFPAERNDPHLGTDPAVVLKPYPKTRSLLPPTAETVMNLDEGKALIELCLREIHGLVFDAGSYCLLVSRYHPGRFFDQTPSLKTEDAVTKYLSQHTMRYQHD